MIHFAAAAQLLGWRPGEFWASTPAELAAALNVIGGGIEAPARADIERLRAQFPDEKR